MLQSFAQEIANPVVDVTQSAGKYIYETDLLTKEFHKRKRDQLRALMPDSTVAVFFANPVRNRSNDVFYEYHQDPNMYYLTGLREPHAMLLIFKDEQDFDSIKTNEIIFVQPRDPVNEVWDGRRLGVEGVKEVLGFNAVYSNKQFSHWPIVMPNYNHVYAVIPNDDIRDNVRDRGDLRSLVKHFVRKSGDQINRFDEMSLNEFMATLRQKKEQVEISLMSSAIDYTCEALDQVMRQLKPGMTEYEAEAIIEFVFKKNGAESPGFPSILGGGENSCILHYTTNRRTLTKDDVLVADIGAEYHGYTADVTRTLPVDGHFTPEQKIIYELVLKSQLAGINNCRPGMKFWDPGKASKDIIRDGLTHLGIISAPDQVINYFMHGTSHYLGLDVHDVGLYGLLRAGQVITVEPGIYIKEGSPCDPKWWNIGVRIEDDILITTGSPEVLSDCVPKTVAEIEAIMNSNSQ